MFEIVNNANASLCRAHRILAALATSPAGLGFAELRRRLDDATGPSTLARLLKALQAEDWIAHDPATGAYRLGSGLRRLTSAAADRAAILQGHLDALAGACGQSALACESVPGAEELRMRRCAKAENEGGYTHARLGDELPLLATAFGIPLLPRLPEAARAAAIAENVARSGDPANEVADCLERLQRDGVLARDERLASSPLGCLRVVAPVAGSWPLTIGLTVVGQSRLHGDAVAIWCARVREAALRLSCDLSTLEPR